MTIMKAAITFDTGDLECNLKKLPGDINKRLDTVFDYNSQWGTTWMKLNAPWTDDTGAARASLIAVAASQQSQHTITVAHGVSYGIWLEVANSGKFAILGPAMRIIGANVMKSMQGMLDGKPPNIGAPIQQIPPVARKAKPVTNKSGNRRSRKQYGRKRST